MHLRIKNTQTTFPRSEIATHFPNTSLPVILTQDDLDFLNLEEVPDPEPSPAEVAGALSQAKAEKNIQINQWRATANQTTFPHAGKLVACDALSRSDIDAVANSIALTGAFPVGFPGAWKATDNSYIMLPDVDAFKAMHASMTLQGTINFGRSQTLKTNMAAATTLEQVNALTWEV